MRALTWNTLISFLPFPASLQLTLNCVLTTHETLSTAAANTSMKCHSRKFNVKEILYKNVIYFNRCKEAEIIQTVQ